MHVESQIEKALYKQRPEKDKNFCLTDKLLIALYMYMVISLTLSFPDKLLIALYMALGCLGCLDG